MLGKASVMAAGLGGALLIGPSSAWSVTLTDSALLPAPIVASGAFHERGGQARAGATVTLWVWPRHVMATLRVGDSFKLQPVATATTDGNGRYDLRVGDYSLLLPYADQDGSVDLEVIGTAGTRSSSFAFTRRLNSVAAPTAVVAADGGSSTESVDLVDGAAGKESSPTPGETSFSDKGVVVDKSCISTYIADLGLQWDLVGQTYSTTAGVTHRFTYTAGADSTLGIGISASGSYGSWSSGGTSSNSSTTSLSYPSQSGAIGRYYDSNWDYRKYRLDCYVRGYFTGSSYETRAVTFGGGSRLRSVAAPAARYCVAEAAGVTFKKTSTAATTWSNGVDISAVLGIDLSSQTGYSTSAEVEYAFSAAHHLCGTAGYPGGSAGQLVATA